MSKLNRSARERRKSRTVIEEMSCSSCGGREFRREGTRFHCLFCGAESQARRITDALCGEGDGACNARAHQLCAACGLPLCERHDDPKIYYWRTPLDWQTLCPAWGDEDVADWVALQSPLQKFPVAGFEPFPWVPFGLEAAADLGAVEARLFDALKPIAAAKEGSLGENACFFECLCAGCFQKASSAMETQVLAYREEYRTAAIRERLIAIERELEQGISYADAWLAERAGSGLKPCGQKGKPEREATSRDFLPELRFKSSLEDWQATRNALRSRLAAVRRLSEKLAS